MMTDIGIVLWKTWREFLGQNDRRWTTFATIFGIPALFGVLLPVMTLFYKTDWVTWSMTPMLWIGLPFMLTNSGMFDSFAGERERHTLPTLLASSLPDLAILFGNILFWALYSWGAAQITMFIALIPASMMHGQPVFYPLETVLAGMVMGFIVALLIASLGVLISLRAATVKQAQQRYGLVLALLIGAPAGLLIVSIAVFPGFAETLIMPLMVVLLEGGEASGALYIFLAVASLMFFDVVFITLAIARFKRAELLLD